MIDKWLSNCVDWRIFWSIHPIQSNPIQNIKMVRCNLASFELDDILRVFFFITLEGQGQNQGINCLPYIGLIGNQEYRLRILL